LFKKLHHLIKKTWVAAAILIILIAVVSSIFRSLTPLAKQYKGDVEHHLTVLLGKPVTIQTMETGWYWFQPVLRLNQITINEGKQNSLYLEKLLVGIDLFKSLWYWRIQPGVLYIDKMSLVFREKNGNWLIDGISTDVANNEMTPERTKKLLGWLSQQERFIIKNVSVHFHLSNGGLIPVNGLNVSIKNRGGSYKLKADATLEQTSNTYFQLLGNFNFDINHIQETKGQLYFSAKHIIPAQWQALFAKSNLKLEGGIGDLALWLDINNGAISSGQAQVKFKRLAWSLLNKKNSGLIQAFAANLGWKPDNNGWQLQADNIHLRVGNVIWPTNQLQVKFDRIQNSYLCFVKSIIIESLLSDAINWPTSIQELNQTKPHGILTDTQALIKDDKLFTLLTRFDHLGWSGRDSIPQVQNISGVINWQPEEGRLELDSENASIKVKPYPIQNLTLLNGTFDWKTIGESLRISIDRFIVSKSDLVLGVQGVVDKVTKDSMGSIRLAANFSGKNIQQWIPYLTPLKKAKPKLFTWLTKDLKLISEATGTIKVNGLAKDFPFDNNEGEFSLDSHASGVELFITSQWRLIKDLEGYIRVRSRNLAIDLIHGDFNGVPVNQMQLRIDDIGKDKETLLIHSIVNGPAQKMLDFVLASPLKEKLTALKMLTLKGLLLLDIRTEIPLYSEKNEILARGDLKFEDNSMLVKHHLGAIDLKKINGNLSFDENGITQSSLDAKAFGYPFQIKIHSEQSPAPATILSVVGEYSIESLKSRFNIPFFSVLEGIVSAQALIKLTSDPNDLDNLNLKSSLKGMAINLPPPLGKNFNDMTPLELNLDFNPQKTIRLRANYNKHLSTDLLFGGKGFDLISGQIRLGSALAVNQNKPGIAVVGSLEGFDLTEWKKVLIQFSTPTVNSSILSKLRIIHVTLNRFTFLKQQFNDLVIKAKLLSGNDWSFNIAQKKIAAELTYRSTTNSLEGFIKYLRLSQIDKTAIDTEYSKLSFSPEQIPNLNLRIDNFSVGNKQIGNITLKSHSSPEHWVIDYCKIDAPFYQFMLNGDWSQIGKKNQTKTQIKLYMSDLAKTLERWEINPVVDARKGYIEFNGGWDDSISNFSLSKISGTLYMELKNGRITHLSPETEEKLGLGKLLSILSLQTIPRRLKLDFSDLSQGYSFDVFKGSFFITKGIMSTKDSFIDGPVAYGSMKGDLDLVRRLYDLDLSISPHITASLPIVATIAGGPIAGIAAWVASKIINQSMQKITAYSYKVSGPWDQPIVQQLSMVKKIEKR
jgi:uncharacterized protein (TIGR02099 family)